MSLFSLESVLNSSYVEVVVVYWNCFLTFLADKATNLDEIRKVFSTESLYFDDFQWKLFTSFFTLLVVNLVLIFITWRVYGKKICDRFMKPATSEAIEELRASVSRLKLPKEHSPRV